MRSWLVVAALFQAIVVLLGECALGQSAFTGSELRPNILWITSEDNGPQLGCYGDTFANTPNIDDLAMKECFIGTVGLTRRYVRRLEQRLSRACMHPLFPPNTCVVKSMCRARFVCCLNIFASWGTTVRTTRKRITTSRRVRIFE